MREWINIVSDVEDQSVDLMEMTYFRPNRTGLPLTIFVSKRGGARHDVRIKVSRSTSPNKNEMTSISVRPGVEITDGPSLSAGDFEIISRWIDGNRDALIRIWEDTGDLDSVDIAAMLEFDR